MATRHNGNPIDRLESFLVSTMLEHGPAQVVRELAFLPGAFVLTLGGRVIECNEEFCKLTGYSSDELHGKPAIELVAPEDRNALEQRLQSRMTDQYHLVLISKAGQRKYTFVCPRYFKVGDDNYRLSEFIDNTSFVALHQEHVTNLHNMAHALSMAIEQRDPYTTGHMSRAAFFAGKLAKLMLLKEADVENIIVGSSIHDIGKIAVPIEILTKPTQLKQFEWECIKNHPVSGHDIIDELTLDPVVKDIVLHHHERQDGSGYPHGLQASDIPIEVSIASLADALDAIAGIRPYRRSYTLAEAIDVIAGERHKYHAEAFAALQSLVKSGELQERVTGTERSLSM